MVNIIIEICKKELKMRFGSKRVLLPLLISMGIPTLVFIPKLQELMSQTDPESELIRFLFFLIIPIMATTLIGITSLINEIRWKTIKPLLVAPVTEGEIILGKSLACIITGLSVEQVLSGIIFLSVKPINTSTLMLLGVVGPLSVVFTTFVFIIGLIKFPTIAEGGGAILLPMSGCLIIFLIFIILKGFIHGDLVLIYTILGLMLLLLIGLIFSLAKKWFNREALVLSI